MLPHAQRHMETGQVASGCFCSAPCNASLTVCCRLFLQGWQKRRLIDWVRIIWGSLQFNSDKNDTTCGTPEINQFSRPRKTVVRKLLSFVTAPVGASNSKVKEIKKGHAQQYEGNQEGTCTTVWLCSLGLDNTQMPISVVFRFMSNHASLKPLNPPHQSLLQRNVTNLIMHVVYEEKKLQCKHMYSCACTLKNLTCSRRSCGRGSTLQAGLCPQHSLHTAWSAKHQEVDVHTHQVFGEAILLWDATTHGL